MTTRTDTELLDCMIDNDINIEIKQRHGEPKNYRVIDYDGPWGEWYLSARDAITAYLDSRLM